MKRDRVLRSLTPLLAWLARRLIPLLAATWRYRVVGEERLAELARSPAVYTFWHGRLLPSGMYLQKGLLRRGVSAAVFISMSRDGDIVSEYSRFLGFSVVRGSSSRGGLAALRGLHRAMIHEGQSVVTAPDGPRGPACEAQPGSVLLAKWAKAPLVPVAAAASRAWRANSWDRMMLPKPFARVAVVIGEPRRVEQGSDLEEEARELGRRIDQAVQEADSLVAAETVRNESADAS